MVVLSKSNGNKAGGRGTRALDAYRHLQEAGLSPSERDVLAVRIRYMDLEAPGITWTAPDAMAFLSGRDPKTSRNADRRLIDRGILSIAEPATAYRATRYNIHLERLREIAVSRYEEFKRNRPSPKAAGRRPKNRTGNRDSDGVKTPVSAQPALRDDAGPMLGAPPLPTSTGTKSPKQWFCCQTGFKVPVALSPTTWQSVVEHVTAINRTRDARTRAFRTWLKDAYKLIRLGHDADKVLAEAVALGVGRPDTALSPGFDVSMDLASPPELVAAILFHHHSVFGAFSDETKRNVFDLIARGVPPSLVMEAADHAAAEFDNGNPASASPAADLFGIALAKMHASDRN